MVTVTAVIEQTPYRVDIKSASGNSIIADEPLDAGGQDAGFSPGELLAASLAACTAATLRMYANRKGWDLTAAKIDIIMNRDAAANKTSIQRKVELSGNLDAAQRERLLYIANNCPIHKTLTNAIEINTALV